MEGVISEEGVGLLFKVVIKTTTEINKLINKPKQLEEFVDSVKPMCDEIEKLNGMMNGPTEETDKFLRQLKRVEKLLRKCSETKWWNVFQRTVYSNELIGLEASMLRFLQTVVPLLLLGNSTKNLVRVNNMDEKLDQVHSILKTLTVEGVQNSTRFACLGKELETKTEEHQEKKNHNQEKNNRKDDLIKKNQNRQNTNMKKANNKRDDWGDEIIFPVALLKINMPCVCNNCPKNVIKDIQSLEGVVVTGYDSGTNMLMVELMVIGKVEPSELPEMVKQKTNKVVELIESTSPKKEDTDKGEWGEEKKKTNGLRSRLFDRRTNNIVVLDELFEQSEMVQVRKTKAEEYQEKKNKNNMKDDNNKKDQNRHKNNMKDANSKRDDWGDESYFPIAVWKIKLHCESGYCPEKVINVIESIEGVVLIGYDCRTLTGELMVVGEVDPSDVYEVILQKTKAVFELVKSFTLPKKDKVNDEEKWVDEICSPLEVLKIYLHCDRPKDVIKVVQFFKGVVVMGYDIDTYMLTVELVVIGKVDPLEVLKEVEQKTKASAEIVKSFTLPKKKDNE